MAEFLPVGEPAEPGGPELFSIVAHSIQMLSDDMPFGQVSQMLRLGATPDALYELEAWYYPEVKDDGPTGRRFLELKMKRIG